MLVGCLFICTGNQQLAAITRQSIGANQCQCALGVTPTFGTQVVPLNVRSKGVALRFYVTCRARMYAIGQLTGKFHNQGHSLISHNDFSLQDKRATPEPAI
jgi:hypothetical protein